MARYTDIDNLIKIIQDQIIDTNPNDLGYKVLTQFIAALNHAPIADVAPRAEVEGIIYKLECLLCHATGSKLSKHTYDLRTMETAVTDYINESYDEGYRDAKSEVAREIFADVEVLLKETCERGYAGSISDLLAELKKKYTEGQK
jgi:hypothetical protein